MTTAGTRMSPNLALGAQMTIVATTINPIIPRQQHEFSHSNSDGGGTAISSVMVTVTVGNGSAMETVTVTSCNGE